MRRIAAIALTALATSGCIGSGSAASSGTSAPRTTPSTNLMITYPVPTCPPGARCVQESKTQMYYIVSRQLTCSSTPATGNYTDPAAACRALADIETKQHQQQSQTGPVILCRCVMSRDAPKAVGYYEGKRRPIRLDACSLCNMKGIGADLALLLPGTRR